MGKPAQAGETLARCAAGDACAFAEIVLEHQAMVYSIAWHFLKDRSLAEEVAQEVFLQLYGSFRSIESAAHLVFWLRKVTAHRAIDQARRRKFEPRLGLEEIPEPAAAVTGSDPIAGALLGRLIGALPPKARMIVILRYQEDLELSEIAEVLGMRLSTVKSLLYRSHTLLREKLERRRPMASARVMENADELRR